MTNRDELRDLLVEVLMLDPEEYRDDLTRDEVETWDSLAVVAIAVGLHETFGHHLPPEEAGALASVPDIVAALERRGVVFADDPAVVAD